MQLFTPEDCKKWVVDGTCYGSPFRQLLFKPLKENGKSLGITMILADLPRVLYAHNPDRVMRVYNELLQNYPPLQEVADKLQIYICPKPSLGFENGNCWTDEIVLWARPTQIPDFMTDYITVHEIGHFVNNKFCPRRNSNELWRQYLELRKAPKGICKIHMGYDEDKEKNVYEDQEDFLCLNGTQDERNAEWRLSPAEWFAEDFRFLFGVDKGEPYWGMPIDPPGNEIKEFMMSLKFIEED